MFKKSLDQGQVKLLPLRYSTVMPVVLLMVRVASSRRLPWVYLVSPSLFLGLLGTLPVLVGVLLILCLRGHLCPADS